MISTQLWPKHFIGLDRLMATMENHQAAYNTYPPYDIVKSGEDSYCVEMALAGFTKSEIKVEVEDNNLTVAGDASDRHDNSDYVHKGIGRRAFRTKFVIGETIEVEGADLTDGVLHIRLKDNIPEEQKPRQITVT
jgi:molecular chaperone IbpA